MNNNRITIAALILGVAMIICFFLVAGALKFRTSSGETIVVTGLAEKDFNSDLIVWTGFYARKSLDLRSAYAQLKADENTIRSYLAGKGVAANEMIFSSVELNKEFEYRQDINGRSLGQEFTGYNLRQTVKVESSNVDKIEKISREVTELIESGVEFNSQAPAYYNTKLTEVKMQLLAEASKDARQRAETIAENAGSKLGRLKKANTGVFQITGKNSNEDYSYGGTFNTSSRNKTGSITIRMEFAVN